jgi:DMSO/TMAO reductase YedYZ molybdopterin-dependent catalytic subunit
MLKNKIAMSLIVGIALAAPLTALNYLANQALNLPFLPYVFFNWMTPLIPGPAITFGIDLMIDTLLLLQLNVADLAKTAEQGMAVMLFLALATAAGALAYSLNAPHSGGERPGTARRVAGWLIAGGFALFLLVLGVMESSGTLAVLGLSVLLALWIGGVSWAARRRVETPAAVVGGAEPDAAETGETRPPASVEQLNRRQFLVTLGTAAATVTVVGSGLGLLLAADERRRTAGAGGSTANAADLPNAGDPVSPAPGTRPEYTPIEDHYKVFLELQPTVIEAEGYVLPITGMVDNELMLTVDDLYTRFESFDQYVTLSCISGRIATTLISTTRWTGISMQDILAEAGVQSGARYLNIESGDGFYETVPLELISNDERIMLCHSWDGAPLPTDHGFPCRIWIPDRFGMKQPKWIVSMELTDVENPGYWVERGWDRIAQVRATSVIDTVAVESVGTRDGQQIIPVGGIAWAGDRQISRVEVQVDGGEWQEARLRTPLSETTWVIWRYDWPFAEGDRTFRVRCFEGDGTMQIVDPADARPSGSTGIHSLEVEV